MATTLKRSIEIEGFTPEEILGLPEEELGTFVFCDEPIVFRAGSAQVLGRFERSKDTLILELAHIQGGGEGVLPTLGALAERFAQREGIKTIQWRVHAINCPRPNLKLRKLLERKGFEIRDIPGSGECYFLASSVASLGDN